MRFEVTLLDLFWKAHWGLGSSFECVLVVGPVKGHRFFVDARPTDSPPLFRTPHSSHRILAHLLVERRLGLAGSLVHQPRSGLFSQASTLRRGVLPPEISGTYLSELWPVYNTGSLPSARRHIVDNYLVAEDQVTAWLYKLDTFANAAPWVNPSRTTRRPDPTKPRKSLRN
jgi:hypothetical protein